ncbi:D-alanyl-D-alanine carboxypeptidase/D-alanyl-D-alanine-endopeptidase [Virgibacillus sp. NKC19-3]|uniref:D-alanyl-D-alanine carboxypeptidase/D-alanyl-D-alanine endopeptidase n=1 Tax=Virgibacillus saliphilus TaxID=2831674 RepID=UPI001C9ABD73|nr:D-alanyl-D-alanine carboxypeptidase/D-alanyl-D-alanine-endopeptidase [Virgibacillus sp. NKC19-3]MBY7144681.1 D-alanyl-D-alanine carboxypeptidase/D-alanyl-D-alanine-endopeptidase [Virgibacillus sp. NKC19-3]
MRTKSLVPFLLIAVMLLIMPLMQQSNDVLVTASQEESESLEEKIDAVLDDARIDGAAAGVSVRSAETGELLYEENGDMRLHPASNMKLLSGAAAMETLGSDYQFSTEIWTDGNVQGSELHGDLYLKGKGDPTLMKANLDQFAKDLKEQGIDQIRGNLVGDDTWYDDVRLSEDLNWSDEPFHTGAQISALTLAPDEDYDAGTIIVEVMAAEEAGEKAEVKVTPETNYVTIVNNTEMVPATEDKDISIERQHGNNEIVIEGEMPVDGSNSKSWASVWEPTGYVMDVFKNALEEQGIRMIGDASVTFGPTPEDADLLIEKQSQPLEEIYTRFMKLSNNGHGEVLVKEMGKVLKGDGSWDAGLDVLEETVADFDMNTDTMLLRDGSGMSHKNMIPANEFTEMLYAIQDKGWYPAFEETLPVAGHPERLVGGTLRYRMDQAPTQENVLAKTGSLTGVSALSGYVTTADGEKLTFSIMFNNYLASSVEDMEDEIATVLAKHGEEDSYPEVPEEPTVEDLQHLVEELGDGGEFVDTGAVHQVEMHLHALAQYENTERTDKAMKHLHGFKDLVEHQRDNDMISEIGYAALMAASDALLEQWE